MDLNYIYQENFSEKEKKAYKIFSYWEEIMRKELPNYFKSKNNKNLRKSYLFKCCMKLINETNGLLDESLYKYYVFAQITTLKNFSDGKVHGLVTPEILFGNNAWIRWKIFKNKLEKIKKEKELTKENNTIKNNDFQIIEKLLKTKDFLISKNFCINKENIKENIQDLKKWSSFNKVSVYFLIYSKTIKENYNLFNDFGIDINLYKNDIRKEVYIKYKEIFGDI